MEAGIQRREDAANPAGGDRCGRFGSVLEGNRESKATIWDEGIGCGTQLLRSRARGILAGSGAEGKGNRKYHRGCIVDRSESTTAASKDGSDGCREAGPAAGAVLAWRTGCMASGAGTERGRRRSPATAPGAGDPERRTKATPGADSIAAVYPRHRREGRAG